VAVLDTPVLGSVPSVTAGRLVIFAGGDRAVFDRSTELLSILGAPIYLGPSGTGAWLKLVSNAASIATLVALGELLALTDRAGIEIEPSQSRRSFTRGDVRRIAPRTAGRDILDPGSPDDDFANRPAGERGPTSEWIFIASPLTSPAGYEAGLGDRARRVR